MDCLVVPVSVLMRRCSARYTASRLGYHSLSKAGGGESMAVDDPVRVVVGKERREFLVDPFVLEEIPFRVLIEAGNKNRSKFDPNGAIFVDVDAILFEHMLWLMHNDFTSLFKLNLREIIDFYAQDQDN